MHGQGASNITYSTRVKGKRTYRKSELQMFLLISVSHIGAPKRYTNMASPVPGDIHSSTYREKKRSSGGIGLLCNTSLKIERVDCNSYASFEYLEVKLHTASTVVRIVVVYRPPSSKVNKLTSAQFFHDFNDLLEHLSVSSCRLLIRGDFNLHVNEPSRDRLTAKFLDFLDSYNLAQHVT